MTTITLKSADSQCLASLPGNPELFVYQQQTLRWLRFGNDGGNDIVQSVMDTTAPHQPVLPYLQAMTAMLTFSKPGNSVLNLGFGGGALLRFIHHYLPNRQVISVEQQGVVVELARRHFQIPDNYPVTIDSADSFLQHHSDNYHLQLIDLPLECLRVPGFLHQCREHLTADGVAVFNLFYQQQQQLPPILAEMRQQFPTIHLLDVNSSPNLIVLASINKDFFTAEAATRARELEKNTAVKVTHYLEQLLPLPARPL